MKLNFRSNSTKPVYVKFNQKANAIEGVLKLLMLILPVILFILIPILIVNIADVAASFLESFSFKFTPQSINTDVLLKSRYELKKDKYGLTNILLLGSDTRSYGSGKYLKNTDTIMIVSYNHKEHAVSMISFPRDMDISNVGVGYWGKINSVYAQGGFEGIKRTVTAITGLSIQYYAMIDLNGFVNIIDKLGGVDVYVEHSFIAKYPQDYVYTDVKFDKGWTTLNGSRALAFARARKMSDKSRGSYYIGSVYEASDYARARRQQKIIEGIIDKAQKQETLQNPKKIYEILKALASSIRTSPISPEDVQAGLTILIDKGTPSKFSLVLDPVSGFMKGGYQILVEPAKAYCTDFARSPTLVKKSGTIKVYNAGNSSFGSKYNSIRARFPYLNFSSGSTSSVTGSYVSNVGGEKYKEAAKYLASKTGLKFKEYTEANPDKIPTPSGVKLVVVLGK